MSLTTLFGLITPYIGKIIVDDILKPLKNAGLLGPLALVLLAAHAGQIFFGALQARVSAFIGYMVIYDIRGALYQKLQELSLSFYDKRQTGAIMARVTSDTREVQRFLTDWIPETLQSFFMIVGIGVLLFVLSWKLTLFVIAPIFATIWFLKKIWPKLHVYFHRFFEKRSRLSALVNDRLSGIRVIRSFGQEETEFKKFDERSKAFRDAGILVEQKWAVYHPFLHFIIMLGTIIVWYVGGKLVFADEMSLGDVIAYSGYLAMFYRPVRMLTRMVNVITNSISAGERIFGVIDTKPEISDSPDAVDIPDVKGKIEFRNVVFGYNKSKPVLKNINIKIDPCEMIGLVGHSGAGKSTTINLICRLYDVDEGEILIDDINIKDISYTDFRKQIGVVLQEPFLFNGSIADNIAYSKPGATKLEIIRAAKTANAHEFIMSKADGYDTNVGERGLQLSAGERQRISIARAILHDPRILILDEATSSVDTETEKQIQEALFRLIEGRTTIAIAHRLSTLRNCNRLLILEHGEQVELGTHDELMKKKGTFYRFVKMQEELSRITTVRG
jgi:ATP-binding cassette subfamily B protein